ncbi:MAG TPA: M23 family metallopeptidase [Candidatus Paceibacterota bacterium]
MYSEETLNHPSFRITQNQNLSEASISRFVRNAYLAVGLAGISAALLGLLILFYPRFVDAKWLFTGAEAADGSEIILHDPGLALLEAAVNPDPNPTKDTQLLILSEGSALLAAGGVEGIEVITKSESPSEQPKVVVEERKKEEAPAVKKVEKKVAPKPAVAKAAPKAAVKTKVSGTGYFTNPVPAGRKSQGIHGNNAVDIAAPAGTPIYASAAGRITVAKTDGGYNSGWGNYLKISHGNGAQTLYAHMSRVVVASGSVAKGQLIGYVGSTGESTGNHLHFEVYGAKNPLAY